MKDVTGYVCLLGLGLASPPPDSQKGCLMPDPSSLACRDQLVTLGSFILLTFRHNVACPPSIHSAVSALQKGQAAHILILVHGKGKKKKFWLVFCTFFKQQ